MGFEEVEVGRQVLTRPAVTVSPVAPKRIRFNAVATRFVREHGWERVSLFWDKQRRRIGIQHAISGAGCKVSHKDLYTDDVCAPRFVKATGLAERTTITTIPLEWNEESKMLEGSVPRK
jgi:hypothetical protein